MMKLIESNIQGCFEMQPNKFEDERGLFVKTFHKPTFESLGLCTEFAEEYYSISKKNVIRGMHFQLPPHDHVKLVYCTAGEVMDVVLDLRKESMTYGQCASFELCSDKANMVYIPKGMAHGFCVRSEEATMIYKVSTVYEPVSDAGILWDSIGVDWLVEGPVISQRDQEFQALEQFQTPFLGEKR